MRSVPVRIAFAAIFGLLGWWSSGYLVYGPQPGPARPAVAPAIVTDDPNMVRAQQIVEQMKKTDFDSPEGQKFREKLGREFQ